jgi:hypothetical protein
VNRMSTDRILAGVSAPSHRGRGRTRTRTRTRSHS